METEGEHKVRALRHPHTTLSKQIPQGRTFCSPFLSLYLLPHFFLPHPLTNCFHHSKIGRNRLLW